MKKLSPIEREELVTKGHLGDILDQKFDQMKIRLKQEVFKEYQEELKQHISALMEDCFHKFEVLYKSTVSYENRIQGLESHAGFR
jgi:hypothetical protein